MRASVYRSSVRPCIYVGRLSATAALRSPLPLRPAATVAAWHPCPAAPVRGKASILSACVFVHPCPGNGGDAAIPKILPHPVGVNRPGASRPGTLHASLLPIACYCRGSSHRARVAVTVAAGERPPSYCQYRLPSVAARLDTWTRAARLSTLRPLPPTPPFLRALSRSDQWPQCVGGQGASVPACGLRWRSTCALALTRAHGSRLFPRTPSQRSGGSNRGHTAPDGSLLVAANLFWQVGHSAGSGRPFTLRDRSLRRGASSA